MTEAAPVSIRLPTFCLKQSKVGIKKDVWPSRHPMTISHVNVQAIKLLRALKAPPNSPYAALKRRLDLCDHKLSIASYWHPAQLFFCSYAAREIQLLAVPFWCFLGLDYGQRQKTSRLHQNLLVLGDAGTTIVDLPRCDQSVDEALLRGCLFAVKGVSSGFEIIIKYLHNYAKPSANLRPFFFDGHGTRTGNPPNVFCAKITARRDGPSCDLVARLSSANPALNALRKCPFLRSIEWFGSGPVALSHTSVSVQREVGTDHIILRAHG